MLNLVEGETITVESLDNSFDPFEVHYGETFIVPEAVKEYKLVNQGNQEKRGCSDPSFCSQLFLV